MNTAMKESKIQRAKRLTRSVRWLNHEEKELYAGAIYAALCWGEYIEKENDKLKYGSKD